MRPTGRRLAHADHLLQVHVHPRIAAHEVAVVRLAVLKLHQLRFGRRTRREKECVSLSASSSAREESDLRRRRAVIRARSTRVSGGARAVSRHPRVRETRERVFARRNRRLDVPSGGLGTSSAAKGAASRAVVVLDCGTRAITLRRVNLSPTAEVSRRGKQGLRARSSGSVSEKDRGHWVCVTDLPGAVACGDARAAARVRPASRISREGPKTRSPARVFINFAPAGF